jgi:hypothetical protein
VTTRPCVNEKRAIHSRRVFASPFLFCQKPADNDNLLLPWVFGFCARHLIAGAVALLPPPRHPAASALSPQGDRRPRQAVARALPLSCSSRFPFPSVQASGEISRARAGASLIVRFLLRFVRGCRFVFTSPFCLTNLGLASFRREIWLGQGTNERGRQVCRERRTSARSRARTYSL